MATILSHASLAREERRRAEEAFSEAHDCVIVATSTLELGIDVGDLDRVIQIDSPPSVASMLQRMGRTGRRAGTRSSFLALATGESAFARATGLLALWQSGFVEPVEPPLRPLHLFAQQIMALALQEKGIGVRDWPGWIGAMPAFAAIGRDQLLEVLDEMVGRDILWHEEGVLWFGRASERTYAKRNFLEILSVITSPPRFAVRHGREDLGEIDQTALLLDPEGGKTVLLGGRAGSVTSIDWKRKILQVVPAPRDEGKPYWIGSHRPLHFAHCQSMKRVMAGEVDPPGASRRATAQLEEQRARTPWLAVDTTQLLVPEKAAASWFTFGGWLANATLASALRLHGITVSGFDNLSISVDRNDAAGLRRALAEIRRSDLSALHPAIDPKAIDELKFSDCLGEEMARRVLEERWRDPVAVGSLLDQEVELVADP